jgi:putative hydrolase of the HAD superfamily
MNGIQAVTFDIGGTLIEPWPSVGHVYAEVATRHGVKNVSAELLQSRFKAAWQARKAHLETRASWEELVDAAFQGLTTVPPSRTFFAELYERFAQPEAWRLFDDVRPTLAALTARGLKLGVISNWDERLRGLLARLQLTAGFDSIVVSCEVGSAKPDPAIFAHAAASLNLPPAAIVHVGDSLEMDVEGARAAGFLPVQVARGAKSCGQSQVRSLFEVVSLI